LRKTMLSLFAGVALMLGGLSFAHADPGPNGTNDHGLCTAYFNGQKNGHDRNGQPGPFQALEDASRAYTDHDGVDNDGDGQVDEDGEDQDLSAAENVFNYCDNTTAIGGSPDHGRFDCIADSDPANPGDQTSCEDNEGPGHS
jgi:hypothetical protein